METLTRRSGRGLIKGQECKIFCVWELNLGVILEQFVPSHKLTLSAQNSDILQKKKKMTISLIKIKLILNVKQLSSVIAFCKYL